MRFRPPVWFLSGLGLFALSAVIGVAVAPQPGPALAVLAQIGLAIGLALAVWVLGQRWPSAAAWGLALGGAWVLPVLAFDFSWGRNTRGGLMAWLLPWAVAVTWQVWAARATQPRGRVLAGLVVGGLSVAGMVFFLLTSGSRGALAALVLATGAVAVIKASVPRLSFIVAHLPWIATLILVLANLVLVYGAAPLAAQINAADVGGADMGRLSIWRETRFLIGEAPWTGFGLASFEGVFSHYARLIRVPLYTYAHQLYLGVWVQQGVLGLAGLGVLFAGAMRFRTTGGPSDRAPGRSDLRPLELASLLSTLTLALHGLVDDSVYGNGGLPLLFLWAGMAAALQSTDVRPRTYDGSRPTSGLRLRLTVSLGLGLLVTALVGGRGAVASAWVNAGAVALARAELAAWPVLQPAPEAVQVAARANFEQALAIEPAGRAGRFRLGLLLTGQGDYPAAIRNLDPALAAADDSRATRKALGMALAWAGEVARAAEVLAPLPEVRAELETYAFYWESIGQTALSQYALSVAERLP